MGTRKTGRTNPSEPIEVKAFGINRKTRMSQNEPKAVNYISFNLLWMKMACFFIILNGAVALHSRLVEC